MPGMKWVQTRVLCSSLGSKPSLLLSLLLQQPSWSNLFYYLESDLPLLNNAFHSAGQRFLSKNKTKQNKWKVFPSFSNTSGSKSFAWPSNCHSWLLIQAVPHTLVSWTLSGDHKSTSSAQPLAWFTLSALAPSTALSPASFSLGFGSNSFDEDSSLPSVPVPVIFSLSWILPP